MTVIENLSPKAIYEGPVLVGAELPITFPYAEAEDVKVMINESDLEYNIDYQVIGLNVKMLREAVKGNLVTVYRRTPLDQQAEFPQNNRFDSAKINEALDKLCMQQQEQRESISRSLKVPISTEKAFNSSLPPLEPDKALKVNKDGTGFEYTDYNPDDVEDAAKEYARQAKESADKSENSNISSTEQAGIATNKAQEATDIVVGFDEHALEKQGAFDINAANKQSLINLSVDKAKLSETNAKISENNAEAWAEGTDEQVGNLGGQHSAKRWSEIAADIVGEGVIDDSQTSLITTYSSTKIEKSLEAKLDKAGDTMTGALKFNDSGYIERNSSSATKGLALFGDKDGYANGASMSLRSNAASGSQAGAFKLETGNNVTGHTHTLQGNPDGKLLWDNEEVAQVANTVKKAGDTMTGNLVVTNVNNPNAADIVVKGGLNSNDTVSNFTQYGAITFIDSKGDWQGVCKTAKDTANANISQLAVNSPNGKNFNDMACWVKDDGSKGQAIGGVSLTSWIKETYINGNSGYMLFSNNDCIQWGEYYNNAAIEVQVMLLKPYRDANYYVSKQLGFTGLFVGKIDGQFFTIHWRDRWSFKTWTYPEPSVNAFKWLAIGKV